MFDSPKQSSFICTRILQKAARSVKQMAGISKLFKRNSNASARAHSVKASVPAALLTATSSVSPHCAWVARQNYLKSRRLVTRTDVRARMSVWSRLFSWCRGNRKSTPDNENIFTMRP